MQFLLIALALNESKITELQVEDFQPLGGRLSRLSDTVTFH